LKHSSDECLLALLDGELTVVGTLRTRAHLRACWECRARLARLEAAAQALAEARSASRFLPEGRIDAARQRFLSRTGSRKDTAPPDSTFSFRLLAAAGVTSLGRRGIAFGFAGMLSVTAAVTVWHRSSPEPGVTVVSPVRTQDSGARRAPAAELPPMTPARVTENPAPAPIAPTEPHRDLTGEHETTVLWLLHEAGMCRGQDIRVHRNAGRLVVTGIVDSAAKRDELRQRLAELDFGVGVDLRDLGEALEQAGQAAGESLPPERVTRVAAPGEPLIREWLRREPMADADTIGARTIDIVNASVRWADRAWSEAWALRDLRERFAPHWHELPSSSRTAVLTMLRDHWSELQALAARQRQTLFGVLPPAVASAGDPLEAIDDWNATVQALFAPAAPVTMPAAALAAQLSSALERIETMRGDDVALAAFVRGVSSIEQALSGDPKGSK
jgi:hypothetical protein